MFQGLLESLLRKVIGEYVEEIDSKNLNMSVYSGVIDLHDLQLKKSLFSNYNLPVKLVLGRIKRLFVRVPWNALSSKPVQLEIQGLQLVVEPLKAAAWEAFVSQQNQFEILETRLIQHCVAVFQDMLKAHQDPDSKSLEEQQGFMMNLTSKVVDNIQVSIKNIHIRYEDNMNFQEPLSLGLTMEKLEIETTNEQWEPEFIDRTHQENKKKPLLKMIKLSNIGFYCSPKDCVSRQICRIEDKDKQFDKFEELFPLDCDISPMYEQAYMSKPISSTTKLKQLSEHAVAEQMNQVASTSLVDLSSAQIKAKDPIYQIDLVIDEINICLSKSQFEALFKVFEQLNDFQQFTDNYLSKQAIRLKKFYGGSADFERNKTIFNQAFLKILTREIKMLSYDGQEVPQVDMVKMQQESTLEPEMSEVYVSLVKYENQLRLKKWTGKVVNNHFDELNEINHARKKEQNEGNQGSMVSYIGSTIGWLGSGVSSYGASYLGAQEVPAKDQDQAMKAAIANLKETGDAVEKSSSSDSEDEFQDAIDEELNDSGEPEIRDEVKPEIPSPQNLQNDIHRMSVQLYNDFSGNSQNTLINTFRKRRNIVHSVGGHVDDTPIFKGQFHLKQWKISLINDSKLKDPSKPFIERDGYLPNNLYGSKASDNADAPFTSDDYNEIMMFSTDCKVEYKHYDAQDLKNEHQIKVHASCKDMGVQVIQRFRQPGASQVSGKSEGGMENNIQTEVHDVIYKMKEDSDPERRDFIVELGSLPSLKQLKDRRGNDAHTDKKDKDLMTIDLLFGNQNIKESMISKMESTSDFVDQELNFKFRPMTSLYRKEFMEFFLKFFEMNEEVNDEVKLRALEEYEKLREAMSLQNVFEGHNQIQSNFKLKIELASSKILLPICLNTTTSNRLESIKFKEAWILNTGNLQITNNKDLTAASNEKSSKKGEKQPREKQQSWKCDQGYNPMNLDITQISMVYVENLQDWQNGDMSASRQVLKDLQVKMLIMIRNNDFKFANPIEKPLIKFKIAADEIKLIFNPITYLHLVNINKCFARPNVDSGDSEKGRMLERQNIFKNATMVDIVKKKGNTLKYWYKYVAVLSGSYIYFYNFEDYQIIAEVVAYFQQAFQADEPMKTEEEDSVSLSEESERQARRPSARFLHKQFNTLNYEEYFLIKGCQNIQNLKEYRQEIQNRQEEERKNVMNNGIDAADLFLNHNLHQPDSGHSTSPGRGASFGKQNLRQTMCFNTKRAILVEDIGVRMNNSMNIECILEFQNTDDREKWKQIILAKAKEINQVLGKGSFREKFQRFDTMAKEEREAAAQLATSSQRTDPAQILGLYDIKLKKLEIVLEGTSKVKLKSRCVDKVTRDVIILSTQQPEQFNREQKDNDLSEFDNTWVYSLSFTTFSLGYTYRSYDDEKSIGIKSLQIEDRSYDEHYEHQLHRRPNNSHKPRFPMLLKSNSSQKSSKQNKNDEFVIKILIQSQSIESPRFADVLMDNDIKIGQLHFNWNPVSFNRVVRFFRYMRYVEEVCEDEIIKIKQSFKIKLQNLHKDFSQQMAQNTNSQVNENDEQSKTSKPSKLERRKTLQMMRKLSNVIQQEQKEQKRRSQRIEAPDLRGRSNDGQKTTNSAQAAGGRASGADGRLGPRDIRESRRGGKGGIGIFSFDKCAQRTTCLDDITILMSVKMQVDKIKIVCIHPQNDSFPVFTKKIDGLKMNYNSHQDHDLLEGQIANFRILDNTNYPRTLDPYKNYGSQDKFPQKLIVGFKDKIRGSNNHDSSSKQQQNSRSHPDFESEGAADSCDQDQSAISFEMTLFHYPLDHTCPIQQAGNNKQFDKLMKVNLKQLQINYMQELMFRLNDYFFYQFMYAATDANPYSDIYERLKIEIDPFAERADARQSAADVEAERFNAKSKQTSILLQQIEEAEESSGSYCDGQSSEEQESKPKETDGLHTSESNDDDSKESSNQSISSYSQRGSRIKDKKKSQKRSKIVNMNYESNEEGSEEDQNSNEIPDEEDYDFKNNSSSGRKSGSSYDKQDSHKNKHPEKNFNFKLDYEEFDLKQYPLTTGLDIMIENPVIVLKDRPYLLGNIEMDLGQISITSYLANVEGKWKSLPTKKTFVNIMEIDMKSVRIDYDNKSYMITPPFDMLIKLERINYSELLLDQFASKGIDFEEFDKSDHLKIQSTAFEMNFKKEIYTYFLRCMDLNINYYDNLAPGFQLFTWNSQDFMKWLDQEQEVVEKYKDSVVKKRIFQFQFPSCSIKLNQDQLDVGKNHLLSELILYNLKIDLAQYLDYRKDITMKSQTFYILYKDLNNQFLTQADIKDPSLKSLIVGPIKSKRNIRTTRMFYNELSSQQPNSGNAKESDFIVDIKMEADGAKVVDVQMKGLKLFLKIDVFYVISNFFLNNFPKYSNDAKDKPTFFEPDYGNYARFVTILNLNDCLICFEQMQDILEMDQEFKQHAKPEDLPPDEEMEEEAKKQKFDPYSNRFFTKTVAFQGQLQYYLVREKGNQIKEELLDQPNKDMMQAMVTSPTKSLFASSSGVTISNQHKLKTQQVHILDFKPFFCDIKDLTEGGIPLKHIYKRQMITPFNLYYNQTDMVEVLLKNVRLLKRQHSKMHADGKKTTMATGGTASQRQELLDQQKQALMNDSNFKFFNKTELNLDLAEIQISFNDLIIFKGIGMKFTQMNQDFQKHMELVADGEDSQSNESDYEITEALDNYSDSNSANDDYKHAKFFENQRRKNIFKKPTRSKMLQFDKNIVKIQKQQEKEEKGSPKRTRKQRTVVYTEQQKLMQDINRNDDEDCNVHFDETEDAKSRKQLRNNIDSKQAKEMKSTQIRGQEDSFGSDDDSQKDNSSPKKPNDTGIQRISMRNVDEDSKKEKNEEELPEAATQNRGIDQIQIVSHGLKFIVINDIDNNFLPVLSTNFSNFKVQWDHNSKQSCIWTDLNSSINFFNVNIGVWEPFIEQYQVKLMINEEIQAKKQNIQLTFNTPLNLNFTEKLVENLYESQKYWQIVSERFEVFKQDQEAMLKSIDEQVATPFSLQRSSQINGPASPTAKSRKTVMIKNFGLDDDDQAKDDGKVQDGHEVKDASDPKFNEEIITPYVIVNKTDMTFIVKRLFEKDRRDLAIESYRRYKTHLNDQNEGEANLYKRKQLINYYRLEQGQIIDYMVDYNHDKFKLGSSRREYFGSGVAGEDDLSPVEDLAFGGGGGALYPASSCDSRGNIHSDSIGEYKSEYIKISFDTTSLEFDYNRSKFNDNKDIKKIDLNEHGYRTHILREGRYMEKLFYGVKLIDFKKVFTIRTQFSLVNRTGFDYLVHFRFKDFSLMKFLESGDSLPLAMRLDDCRMQIKMIDPSLKERNNYKLSKEKPICPKTGRPRLMEELQAMAEDISDYRDPKLKYKNWTAFVPLVVLKNRLNFNDCSFLTNSQSRYTFIRKTIADYVMKDKIIDINLMPPMIVKNCLPFDLVLKYRDSSKVLQKELFRKNETKNLFCFTMAHSVQVEVHINGFEQKKDFKIFNLEDYKNMEDKIELEDRHGRKTIIYTQISRKDTGQRIIFYCKKILIDSIQSELNLFYKAPTYFSQNESQIVEQMIPFVEQADLKQKFYIIPEGYSEIYTSLIGEYRNESFKIDIETPTTQIEFKLQNRAQSFNYCYSTNVYLATSDEYIYTKITTVNPYYIFVNQSNYSILIEQAEMRQMATDNFDYQLPMILEPNQRQAFFFSKINPNMPGIDEFMHIKLLDEEISGQDLQELLEEQEKMNPNAAPKKKLGLSTSQYANYGQGINFGLPQKKNMMFTKQYNWSSPFMISEVDQFTLQIRPHVRKQRLQEQMNGLNLQERILLTKIMNDSQYLRVKCKADLQQALGSMFIVIEEEDEETCDYMIRNQSKNIEIMYSQHIINNPLWNSRLMINDRMTQKCKTGQSARFTWDSCLHQKVLRVSFCVKGRSLDETDILEISDLSKDQEFRVIPNSKKKFTEILIPFDKIGHIEQINLTQEIDMTKLLGIKGVMPSLIHKLKIAVATNGFTKFLKITDVDEAQVQERQPLRDPTQNLMNYSIMDNEDSLQVKMRMVELSISSITLSFIHKRCELMTIFISKMHTHITETEQLKNIKFSIGYLQIDNQAESDPVYPILLKPRDLDYNVSEDKIVLKLKQETDHERKEREAQGLSTLTSDDAKMFQLQMLINNKSSNTGDAASPDAEEQASGAGNTLRKPEVLYIENIMFLLQTLNINVQFSHFLKLADFIQHLGKILNKSVHQVHYIYEDTSGQNYEQHQPSSLPHNEIHDFLTPQKNDSRENHRGGEQLLDKDLLNFSEISQEDLDSSANQFREDVEMADLRKLQQDLYLRKGTSNIYSQSYKKQNTLSAASKAKEAEMEQKHYKQQSFKARTKHSSFKGANEDSSVKKQDRLKNFAKQGLLRSLHGASGHTGGIGTGPQHNQGKIEAVMMSKIDNNWQCSNEKIISNQEWRLFIKEYQSSPTELIVSAINERLNKDSKDESASRIEKSTQAETAKRGAGRPGSPEIVVYDGDNQEDETIREDGAVKIMGALGEVIARKILFFSTFEDMEFQMNGLNISNLFGEGNEVMNQLANYHKETFKFNALRLLGASNLIGNPSRFVNNIGTGVSDFFVKPYQGIKDGGIVKMKDGFMDGSKSLIKNSLMAPVGAMAKIGQSISKGTLALSFDDKFVEEKSEKERRNQPKSMSDGMKKGFASAGSSIYSGVRGVFTKPIEGAKNEGLFGFLKGGAQGAAGLVTKTISGGIDIIAKTSEGLDNQSKSLTQLKVAHRIRRPRPFYEVDNIIRAYNEFHSFWVTMVPQLNDQIDICKLYDVFQIHEDVKLIKDDKRDPHPESEPTPENCIQEQQSSIFVMTKYVIIEIKSIIKLRPTTPEERKQDGSNNKLLQAQKNIEKIYTIKHIDFIEIAGDDNTVLIIGFRQNQSELVRRGQATTEHGPIILNSAAYESANDQTVQIRELEKMASEQIKSRTPFRSAVGNEFLSKSQVNMVGRSSTMSQNDSVSSVAFSNSTFVQKEAAGDENPPPINTTEEDDEDSALSQLRLPAQPQFRQHGPSNGVSSQYRMLGQPRQLPLAGSLSQGSGGSKITSTQLGLLRNKLREQVELHQLQQHLSGSQARVSSSHFHLQIEFDNAHKAKEIKGILEKIKRLHRKEKALRQMMWMQSQATQQQTD